MSPTLCLGMLLKINWTPFVMSAPQDGNSVLKKILMYSQEPAVNDIECLK